eukprot:CAMPEP_0173440730 /NCGR_PEP_ID=MMETSP1357-20121228/23505_1 /TAXON_ID=77926 /ORGANISM="Hemiselmis rufescens, Strain PCC563" /LENGTH=41 /DNA_ID= /DNA_START= /DNA_END= /DNA_ORIENTATION=
MINEAKKSGVVMSGPSLSGADGNGARSVSAGMHVERPKDKG